MTTKVSTTNGLDYILLLPDEILTKICEIVSRILNEMILAWKNPTSSFPYVCKRFKGIYIDFRYRFLYERAIKLNGADSVIEQQKDWDKLQINEKYLYLYSQINLTVSPTNGYRYAEMKVHTKTSNIVATLFKENFETQFETLKTFIEAGAKINVYSASRRTPLLILCKYVADHVIGSSLNREQAEERVFAMFDYLLLAGSDPNLEGFPSTPLLTLLYEQPLSPEDVDFVKQLVKKLVMARADIHLVPSSKDTGGYQLSPLDYARKHYPVMVDALKTRV